MKVPLSWLNELLPTSLSPQEIAHKLTMLGLEVDAIENKAFTFFGVVVGEVIAATQHPNADRLRVATVSDGLEQWQVVCGAPNCRLGIKVALAKIGATLQDKDGKSWKIKKSKLREVESYGMLCAESELGLPETNPGMILELSADAKLGVDVSTLLADPIFEISLTPNLGHCLSVLGVARELGASLKQRAHLPKISLQTSASVESLITASVLDSEKCPRYSCRYVHGVSIGPSPTWLKNRLEKSGMRSINNVVDISNYVMLEVGMPLHMFDADRFTHQQIIIKPAEQEETIDCLDGITRSVPAGTLIIYDGNIPAAIAGVIGAASHSVTENTVNILIESAVFLPQSIRKTSKILDLKSDASIRFDRGVDWAMIPYALDRAVQLLKECASGAVAEGKIDIVSSYCKLRSLSLRADRIQKLIGIELSLNELRELLLRLEIETTVQDESVLVAAIPSYRNDLQTEIDLVEEIARIFGYDLIPRPSPYHLSATIPDTPLYQFEKMVRKQLIGAGLQECITCDLISPALARLTLEKTMGESALISVLHPRSIEQSILRTSLLPGLLLVVRNNLNQRCKNLQLFEIGRVHFKDKELFCEQSCLGVLMMGKRDPHHWNQTEAAIDFYDIKGVIDNLLASIGVSAAEWTPSHLHSLHPGRQAKLTINDLHLGIIGEVHPLITQAMGIEERLYFAEINLHDLSPTKRDPSYQELPLYPGSERDWTLSLKAHTPIAKVMQAIKACRRQLLAEYSLLSLYQVNDNHTNVTLRFCYRDVKKTLDFESVEKEHQQLIQEVAKKLHDSVI